MHWSTNSKNPSRNLPTYHWASAPRTSTVFTTYFSGPPSSSSSNIRRTTWALPYSKMNLVTVCPKPCLWWTATPVILRLLTRGLFVERRNFLCVIVFWFWLNSWRSTCSCGRCWLGSILTSKKKSAKSWVSMSGTTWKTSTKPVPPSNPKLSKTSATSTRPSLFSKFSSHNNSNWTTRNTPKLLNSLTSFSSL